LPAAETAAVPVGAAEKLPQKAASGPISLVFLGKSRTLACAKVTVVGLTEARRALRMSDFRSVAFIYNDL